MIVSIVNKYYKSVRKVDRGIDPGVSSFDLSLFVATKFGQRMRSALRGRLSGFQGPRVAIVGARQLTIGKNVALGGGVRINAMSVKGVSLGDGVTIDEQATLRASGVIRNLGVGIEVGTATSIGAFNFIHGGGGVAIGANCLLGPYVSIYSENHNFRDGEKLIRLQGETRAPVTIEDDVWIGSGSTILPGVTLGTGAVVGAGSVVTRSVAPFTVVAGVPAKTLMKRSGVENDEA